MKRKISLLLNILIVYSLNAQYKEFQFPTTPEGNTLNSYFNQISTSSTGVPDISIPLYSITIGDQKLPITLNYVGGTGINVDQIASRVGLGWMLNVGGNVEKTIVGRPDSPHPKIKNTYDLDGECYHTNDWGFLVDLVANEFDPWFEPAAVGMDMRPDVYSYSLLNSSGKFIFDHNGKAQQIPKTGNEISDKLINDDSKISIIDDNGISYEFQAQNYSTPSIVTDPSEHYVYMNTYYPSKIKFPNSQTITYHYDSFVKFSDISSVSQREFDKVNSPVGFCNTLDKTVYSSYGSQSTEYLVTSIDFPEGKMLFNYSVSDREDHIGDKKLIGVEIFTTSGTLVKSYSFNYDYFVSPIDLKNNVLINDLKSSDFKRLKLLSITENQTAGTFSFDYYENHSLPARFSSSVDSWGLYNGKENGNSRIGSYIFDNHYYYSNRSFVEDFAKTGLLKKIIYPSKGSTEFVYEPDDYYYNKNVDNYTELLNDQNEPYNDSNYVFLYNDILGSQVNRSFSVNSNDFDFRGFFYSEMNDGGGFPPNNQIEECRLSISSPGTNTIVIRENGNKIINLIANKTYSFTLQNNASDPNLCYFNFSHRHKSTSVIENRQVGSFRIKNMVQNDNQGNSYTKAFEYKKDDGSQSSGIMMDDPITYRRPDNQIYKNNIKQPIKCSRFFSSNDSPFLINSHFGKPISYSKITEKSISNGSVIKKENYYKNDAVGNDGGDVYGVHPKPIEEYKNGVLYKTINYSNNLKVSQTYFDFEYDYTYNQFSNDSPNNSASPVISNGLTVEYENIEICSHDIEGNPSYGATFKMSVYPIYSAWVKKRKEISSQYFGTNINDSISVDRDYYYSPGYSHINPIRIKETYSSGEIMDTDIDYSSEKGNTAMNAANMTGIPLETTVLKNGKTISKSGIDYQKKNIGGKELILPDVAYGYDLQNPTASTTEIKYTKYDSKGNLQEYVLKPDANGIGNPVTIIWGYNNTQPIVKVEGATYAEVSGHITDIVNYSNIDASPPAGTTPEQTEQDLIYQLDAFRKKTQLAGFQITTYTYDPLVGVRSITPPSGIREIYTYDTANRLIEIRDVNGNIRKQFEYNYKH